MFVVNVCDLQSVTLPSQKKWSFGFLFNVFRYETVCATLCCALQRCFEVLMCFKLYGCAIAWSEGKRMESKNVETLICSLSILCTANGVAREWSILCNSRLSQQLIKIDAWLFRGSIRDQCVSLFKFTPLKNVRKQNTMISALHFFAR